MVHRRRHLYFVLIITLGLLTIRKGHWVMFIIGIFIPLLWFVGAMVPPVADAASAAAL